MVDRPYRTAARALRLLAASATPRGARFGAVAAAAAAITVWAQHAINDRDWSSVVVLAGVVLLVVAAPIAGARLARCGEYDADAFAAKAGLGPALAQTLTGLHSQDHPPRKPFAARLLAGHPEIASRVAALATPITDGDLVPGRRRDRPRAKNAKAPADLADGSSSTGPPDGTACPQEPLSSRLGGGGLPSMRPWESTRRKEMAVTIADEDPYESAARHLREAAAQAGRAWSSDGLNGPWADVVEALGLALMGLPPARPGAAPPAAGRAWSAFAPRTRSWTGFPQAAGAPSTLWTSPTCTTFSRPSSRAPP